MKKSKIYTTTSGQKVVVCREGNMVCHKIVEDKKHNKYEEKFEQLTFDFK